MLELSKGSSRGRSTGIQMGLLDVIVYLMKAIVRDQKVVEVVLMLE